jgi:hypothetical protein
VSQPYKGENIRHNNSLQNEEILVNNSFFSNEQNNNANFEEITGKPVENRSDISL